MVHRPLVPTSWFSRPGADSVRGLSSLDQVLEQLLLDPDFRRSLSSDQIRECGSLLQERDPALLAEAVFSLGHQLERSEALQAAIEIYQALGSSVGAGALQARARGRLDAILGQGPVQNRLEDLGRRFVRQATEPSAIFSFAIAGGIAGMVRSSVLSGLALRAPSFWTRGLMARGLAGTAAYLAEVPAFVGAGRFSRALISNPGAGAGEPSLSQEFSGAAIFLGVLKFGGFLGQASFGRLTRNELLRGLGGSLSQVGSIYLGHRLQEFAGLRPGHGEANRWVDSLDAWLQMRVGGRLLGHSSEASRRR
ncbi:MAG: hypothetical protein K8R69_07680 [Deltaproteobacteria bacterium]|nr:hypothetical protein [Deltaproteobacteria bacterium]